MSIISKSVRKNAESADNVEKMQIVIRVSKSLRKHVVKKTVFSDCSFWKANTSWWISKQSTVRRTPEIASIRSSVIVLELCDSMFFVLF